MVRREFHRGVDLELSWRGIFSYEEVKLIRYFVSVSGPVCGFICDEVVEIVGDYFIQDIFSSYCNKSGGPLGMFGIIVSSSYESIAQSVKEVINSNKLKI